MDQRDIMNKTIRISDLFKTKKDMSKMNDEERMEYISQLSDEFMDSADALMKSLANKQVGDIMDKGIKKMAVSMGEFPVLKGKSADKVLNSLKNPTMDKEFLKRYSILASEIKKGKSKKYQIQGCRSIDTKVDFHLFK